jgi:transcriptional regulator with XRE-family HTH domain
MSGRSKVDVAAERTAAEIRRGLGKEVTRLRHDAALSRAAVARAAGVNPSTVGRVETASIEPDLETIVRIASTLGCDLSIRLFPSGAPLHDRFQAPMLEAFLATVHPAWRQSVEVPVVGTVRGVVDCALGHPARPLLLAAEVQSEIRRAEEIIRRSTDKANALPGSSLGRAAATLFRVATVETSRILIVRSTAGTRAVVRDLEHAFSAAYPARTIDALTALRDPLRPWPGPAIIWVNLHGRRATVMDGPPKFVSVGR